MGRRAELGGTPQKNRFLSETDRKSFLFCFIFLNPLTSGLKKDHSRFTPEDLSEMSAEKSFSAGRPLRDERGKIIFRRKTSARCQISCASPAKNVLFSAERPLRDASTESTALRIATNQK